MKRTGYFPTRMLLVAVLLAAGCAAPFSEGIKSQVNESITLDQVAANQKAYQGTLVMWSGVILSTLPREKGTVIEILERPYDSQKRPRDVDTTRGRFLARYNGFLDPAVFCQGRDITVAGRISGSESAKIGEYAYTYPVVELQEYRLWPVEMQRMYPAYPIYPFYDPWWWYY